MTGQRYIPALAYRPLTALYDPIVRLTTLEHRRIKTVLLEQAQLHPGQKMLDRPCGTGILALSAKRLQPQADVIGVDGDPQILSRAQIKCEKADVNIQFDDALAQPALCQREF